MEAGSSLAGEVITTPIALQAAGRGASVVSCEGAVLLAEVLVGPGVDLSHCRFDGAAGLHHLRFADRPWPTHRRLQLPATGPAALRFNP